MSILIKGIDMPVACYDCDLVDVVSSCPCQEMSLSEYRKLPPIRHADCPLVEVKDEEGSN